MSGHARSVIHAKCGGELPPHCGNFGVELGSKVGHGCLVLVPRQRELFDQFVNHVNRHSAPRSLHQVVAHLIAVEHATLLHLDESCFTNSANICCSEIRGPSVPSLSTVIKLKPSCLTPIQCGGDLPSLPRRPVLPCGP